MTRPRTHFNCSHPLAEVAARHCRQHARPRRLIDGRVACGPCWELAIRDDEKVVIEHDLPRELDIDLDYIDQVAVRQALDGQDVPLTRTERAEVARLRGDEPSYPFPTAVALRLVA